jgi:hypothetical protein
MARLLAQTGARPLRAFDRYARVTATPADTTPESILLDFDATEFQRTDGELTLEIDELCLPVTDRHFTCVVNDTEYEVRIVWNAANARYELSSERLDTRYTRQHTSLPGGSETLLVHLNRNQAFRIVPRQTASSYVVYTSGVFVDPRLPAAVPRRSAPPGARDRPPRSRPARNPGAHRARSVSPLPSPPS